MYEILLIVYLLVALCLVFLILIQQGKGADMGASFGAGSSNTLFGATGSGNFLTKTTTVLATSFFVLSIILGNLTANQTKQTDEWENLGANTAAEVAVPLVEDVPADQGSVPSGDVPVSDVPAAESNAADSGEVPTTDDGQ